MQDDDRIITVSLTPAELRTIQRGLEIAGVTIDAMAPVGSRGSFATELLARRISSVMEQNGVAR